MIGPRRRRAKRPDPRSSRRGRSARRPSHTRASHAGPRVHDLRTAGQHEADRAVSARRGSVDAPLVCCAGTHVMQTSSSATAFRLDSLSRVEHPSRKTEAGKVTSSHQSISKTCRAEMPRARNQGLLPARDRHVVSVRAPKDRRSRTKHQTHRGRQSSAREATWHAQRGSSRGRDDRSCAHRQSALYPERRERAEKDALVV